MTKNEIVKYIFSTPENTNPNVLRSMLNEIDGGSGDTPSVQVVTIESDQMQMTWQEINDVLSNNTILICRQGGDRSSRVDRMYVMEAFFDEAEKLYVISVAYSQFDYYVTDSPSGYPAFYTPNPLPSA